MHLHTADGLVIPHSSMDDMFDNIARQYVLSFQDMTMRAGTLKKFMIDE
jgi:hypothetical protein